jgi:hypothetical protein
MHFLSQYIMKSRGKSGVTCNSKENRIKVLAFSLSYTKINRKFSLYDKQIEKNQLN